MVYSDFIKQFKNVLSILSLDKAVIANVSSKKESTLWAIIFFVLPIILNIFLAILIFPTGFGAIFSRFLFWPIVIPFLSFLIVLFLISFGVGKFLGKKVDFGSIFRVFGYASVVLWLTVISFLLNLIFGVNFGLFFNAVWVLGGILIFVVLYTFLKDVIKLNSQDVLVVIISAYIGYFLVQMILGRILVGPFYRIFI